MLNDEEQLYDIYHNNKHIGVVSTEIYEIICGLKQDNQEVYNSYREVCNEKARLIEIIMKICKEYNLDFNYYMGLINME